jgi:hypothetical protein
MNITTVLSRMKFESLEKNINEKLQKANKLTYKIGVGESNGDVNYVVAHDL